jgi:hypothetical protein
MKRQDDPDKATWTLQQERREKVRLMEILCDWLNSGRSVEEVAIVLDIHAAAGDISERLREVSHEALQIIKAAI